MKLKYFIFAILTLIVAGIGWYISLTKSFSNEVQLDEELVYTVKSGATIYSIASDLQEKGVVDNPDLFKWMARLDESPTIFAATYSFKPGMTYQGIYDAVTRGESLSDEVQITFIEGWYLDEFIEAVVESGIVGLDEMTEAVTTNASNYQSDYWFLADLPEGASLEGYLFPNTYRFFEESSADVIVHKLLTATETAISDIKDDIENSGISIHEFFTLASIVQDEVRGEDEMERVAGIFYNRLADGIPLQSDATVNYITRSGRDRSTFADLEIDSPYNTYKYAGLPAGPIGHPGSAAIHAAVNPEEHDYYYFLTDKAGRVYYAKTLDEHANNRQYLDRE